MLDSLQYDRTKFSRYQLSQMNPCQKIAVDSCLDELTAAILADVFLAGLVQHKIFSRMEMQIVRKQNDADVMALTVAFEMLKHKVGGWEYLKAFLNGNRFGAIAEKLMLAARDDCESVESSNAEWGSVSTARVNNPLATFDLTYLPHVTEWLDGCDSINLDSPTEKQFDDQLAFGYTSVSDRDEKRDKAIVDLGNCEATANNLLGWLDKTEKLIGNQRAPSSDHKVVRAQLREQNLLLELMEDKHSDIESLAKMVDKLAVCAEEDPWRKLCDLTKSVSQKCESLQKDALDRKKGLEDTLELAEAWAHEFEPFLAWLDNAERKLQKLDSVPTDEDKLKSQMNDHHNLNEDIGGQRNLLDNIMELGTRLRDFVSDEDADSLAGQMADSAIRYDRLGTTSEALEKLLDEMLEGMGAFFANTEIMEVWLDDIEIKIRRFDVISVFAHPLKTQTADMMTLAEEIANNQERVLAVLEEGHELCKHTSGDEAIVLQSRLDSLRLRYADLSIRADNRLSVMQGLEPLADVFRESHQKLSDWLVAIEADLAGLDEATPDQQQSLLENFDEDISAFKPTLEKLKGNGTRLGRLNPGEGTTTLDGMVSLINTRFDAVAQQVQSKRSELLNLSKEQSNATCSLWSRLWSFMVRLVAPNRSSANDSRRNDVVA